MHDRLMEEIEYLSQFVTAERLSRIEKVLNERTRYVTVALENIYQPHNASAVVRSAEALGIQDLHVIENINEFSPVKGTTIGADKWLTFHRYETAEECIKTLKKRGYTVAATVLSEKTVSLYEVPLDTPIAFLFGTEDTGLSPEAIEHSDIHVKIPMYGFSQSFNVSVSAAIVLHYVTKRLRDEGIDFGLTEKEKLELKHLWLKRSIKKSEELLKRLKEKS